MCDSVENVFFPFWNMEILKLLNQVAEPLVTKISVFLERVIDVGQRTS